MFRTAVTIAFFLACLVSPAVAQKPRGQAQKQRQQQQLETKRAQKLDAGVRKFQRTLNLSDAQTEQLRALLSTREQELKRLREGNGKGRKADARALKDQFQANLRAILTPEQAQIFDQKFGGKKK